MKHILMALIMVSYASALSEAFFARVASDVYTNKSALISKYKSIGFNVNYEEYLNIPTLMLRDDKEMVVVFRGTNSMQNWSTNAAVKAVPYKNSSALLVHSSYYKSASIISQQLQKKLNKKSLIHIVGHSLGGAIGLFCALELQEKGYRVTLHTYGMPPIGNSAFVHYYRKIQYRSYVHIFDIVPSLTEQNLEIIQKFSSALKNSIEPNSTFLFSVFRSLERMPKVFAEDSNSIVLYEIYPPKQDILPQVWMLPAYYHLAINYATILDPHVRLKN